MITRAKVRADGIFIWEDEYDYRSRTTPFYSKLLCRPISENALRVMSNRYLRPIPETNIPQDQWKKETPYDMYIRVAENLARVESKDGSRKDFVNAAEIYYSALATGKFTPAGRTLANKENNLQPNCIVLHIEDSMESILETLKHAGLLQKAGSGLGFPLHLMRPAGAPTISSEGSSSGPISFLDAYNRMFSVIKQQNRHGANMAVMSVTHPDILDFIHCKDREGDLKNFNVSVGLTDSFMKAVKERSTDPWICTFDGKDYNPRRISRTKDFITTDIKEVKMTAAEIFDEILDSAWRTGEPGCVFLDTVNAANPLPGCGRIEACNPCGEQFLHDGDVCNLGAINLEHFVDSDRSIDWRELRRIACVGFEMMDNVVDTFNIPVQKVRETAMKNRRLGLGIMGFADMLYKAGIAYNSPEGRDVATRVMQVINEAGVFMSRTRAKTRGTFENWPQSVFYPDDPRRNCALTCVAPTGTISMANDCSGGVEPYFALAYYYKNILDGKTQLTYVNKHLEKALRDAGCYSEELMDKIIKAGSVQKIEEIPEHIRKVFVTAMDISAEDHILMQAAFQKHCDNAISKTINFPNSATREDIRKGYILAWESGCKGCTVYRDGSRQEQVLNLVQESSPKQPEVQKQKSITLDPAFWSTPEGQELLAKRIAETEKRLEAQMQAASREAELHCPECKTEKLVHEEGCKKCLSCGWSACSKI